jgi:hypothetical protein
MIFGILMCAWVGIGLGLACYIDRREMKAHVPYGNLPAGFSLEFIRVGMFFMCGLLAVPIFAYTICSILWNRYSPATLKK